MNNFQISDYLENYNRQSINGKCKSCSKIVTWSRVRVAAHIRTSCPNSTEAEKKQFAKHRNEKVSTSGFSFPTGDFEDESMDDSYTEGSQGKDQTTISMGFTQIDNEFADLFDMSQYMENFDKPSQKGTCKACYAQVRWTRDRLACHKKSSCPDATAEEKEFFAKYKMQQNSGTSHLVINIEDYLEDRDNASGKCKACSATVTWSRDRIASHKRVCTAATAEDKILFAKTKSLETSSPNLDRVNIKNFIIGDFLMNFNRDKSNGQCKTCSNLVSWSRQRVAAHKRTTCLNATDAEQKFFAKTRPEEINIMFNDDFGDDSMDSFPAEKPKSDSYEISQFLENFDKPTQRGTCKACFAQISWSRERVACHKRRCVAATAEEKEFFTKMKSHETSALQYSNADSSAIKNFSIADYLEHFNREKSNGKCRVCPKLVSWSRERVAAHKRTTCPNATQEEKNFFAIEGRSRNYQSHDSTTSSCATPRKETKVDKKCYICNSELKISKIGLETNLGFTNTQLYELLESFIGTEVTQDDLKNSAVCVECFFKLNKYDEFQHSSQLIQATICTSYQNTRSSQVFVKQEPEYEYEDDSSQYFNEYFEPEVPVTPTARTSFKVEPEMNLIGNVVVTPSKPAVELNFRCDKCPHRTVSRAKLEFHMISVHGDEQGPFKCPVCSKVFEVKASFRRHFHDHRELRRSLCPR